MAKAKPLLKPYEVVMHRMKNPTFSIMPWDTHNGLTINFYDHAQDSTVFLTKIEARILMRRLQSIFDRHDFGEETSGMGAKDGICMKDIT